MASDNTYTVEVQHNDVTDEYYVILPESLLQQMKWQAGDEIDWKLNKNGTIILRKVNHG